MFKTLNRDIDFLKTQIKRLEMKIAMSELKNTQDGINSITK